jgi:hypothetical protein
MSADPAGAAAADPKNPMTWGMYSYANSDPLNYYDPDGLDTTTPCSDLNFIYAGQSVGTVQQALDLTENVTDIAETEYTESGHGTSVNSQLEEDEIGAVIMNRFALVNGYAYLYPAPGQQPVQVVRSGACLTALSRRSSRHRTSSRFGAAAR